MNKAEEQYPVQTGSTFAKGIFIGGLLGAAAALLFAPKPGRELRGDLSEKVGIVTDRTKEVATVVSDKATELAKTVSSKTSDIAKTVNQGRNDVMDSVRKASADVANEASRASDEVAAASVEAKEDARKELNSTSL
ncbi:MULTISPECIES: YtxH domain-containing protein [Paenibacillus]|jgi:gas vesicle protein|uniref:YtxH domain-containing protein n=1 Tax=Paenibacillus amylolyticus TaxID=1451 RepID=A0ABD8AQF1_PAEAM|nr:MULTISPECIES: YtxH domain-containing protein [Paenibacillus]UOK62966.1 YtxH domain-containing protein [Paenibacillus sp. OVF10]KAA8756649.1 YtxH domain-containing protein [Paenibacillus sp. UASWS1643]MBD8841392.1 YtxH domain-containing protein [Paenibacillus sp. CFBP 13594]MBY0116388.1 YtxH domain-containing protein [Paenibacillus xylanexedens]MCF7758161.1 YtxH domain-containing protein [Paenibacillus xylanexedens]